MKIPFDIKFRPQIESGEYKVETRCGLPARIICWDRLAKKDTDDDLNLCVLVPEEEGEAVYYYHSSGKKWVPRADYDLFIITPEEALTEFEERIFTLLRQYKECDIPLTPENIKAEASMLWRDFEEYFFVLYGKEGEGDSALRSFYYKGLADGKADALKDVPRWERSHKTHLSTEVKNYALDGDDAELWLLHCGRKINIKSLEKLPRFKEE